MSGLIESDVPLLSAHDVLLVDLDGVVYLGDDPIDAAPIALAAARSQGVGIVFVTNNASRPPAQVAATLNGMGITTTADEVMTSAVGAAQELAGRLVAGAPVLVVGGAGVREALLDVGLRPVDAATDDPVAVLQGFAPDVGWRSLAEASVALAAGAIWIATNADLTLPSPRGPLPGNGSLVAALAAATGQHPQVIGKPGPALFLAAIQSHPARHPLVVGDRLDTDIAGANAAGLSSLCVLSGVSEARDLVLAAPQQRPSYIGRDLGALAVAHPRCPVDGGSSSCRQARATVTEGVATVSGSDGPDGLDRLRALCALAWEASGDQPEGLYAAAIESLNLR